MSNRRVERLADLLKEEISEILFHRMRDPRLSLCNVSSVVLSADYRHAKVYISVIGTPQHRDDCMRALNAAAGFFRRELGKLNLRHIPSLSFYYDSGAEYSQHIDELLKTVKKDDEPEE